MRDRATGFLHLVSVGCAVLVTGLLVRRELVPRHPAPPEAAPRLGGFDTLLTPGHRIGSATAPVVFLEFGDFECPICRQFAPVLQASIRAHPGEVALVFRHWPLSYHPHAFPAALAAECAGAQGKFAAYHDALYSVAALGDEQSFSGLARSAGVADVPAFARCVSTRQFAAAVERDGDTATRLGGEGTPLLFVNGRRLPGATDSLQLDRVIESELKRLRTGD
jgi:protein-disulfide isomerase